MVGTLRSWWSSELRGPHCVLEEDPEPTPAVKTAAPPAPAAANAGGDGKLDPNDPKHGAEADRPRHPVYVDGSAAVLRAGEMPVIKAIELEGGGRRFLIATTSRASASRRRLSRFNSRNGDKIASIEGTELRKEPGRFVFSFISGDTGARSRVGDRRPQERVRHSRDPSRDGLCEEALTRDSRAAPVPPRRGR